MESRDSKLIYLVGLIATHGKDFNELKLEQLLKIVEQPDINIELDEDGAGAPNVQAFSSTDEMECMPTRGMKRAPDDSVDCYMYGHKKRRVGAA